MDNKKDNFITLLTFTYPHELAVVRGRLESEDIETQVQDEFTVQVNPFYSNAIGGVKLKVKESDYEKAVEIVKEAGYHMDSDFKQPGYVDKFNQYTSRVPFLNGMQPELRLMILVAVVFGMIVTVLYFLASLKTFWR